MDQAYPVKQRQNEYQRRVEKPSKKGLWLLPSFQKYSSLHYDQPFQTLAGLQSLHIELPDKSLNQLSLIQLQMEPYLVKEGAMQIHNHISFRSLSNIVEEIFLLQETMTNLLIYFFLKKHKNLTPGANQWLRQ